MNRPGQQGNSSNVTDNRPRERSRSRDRNVSGPGYSRDDNDRGRGRTDGPPQSRGGDDRFFGRDYGSGNGNDRYRDDRRDGRNDGYRDERRDYRDGGGGRGGGGGYDDRRGPGFRDGDGYRGGDDRRDYRRDDSSGGAGGYDRGRDGYRGGGNGDRNGPPRDGGRLPERDARDGHGGRGQDGGRERDSAPQQQQQPASASAASSASAGPAAAAPAGTAAGTGATSYVKASSSSSASAPSYTYDDPTILASRRAEFEAARRAYLGIKEQAPVAKKAQEGPGAKRGGGGPGGGGAGGKFVFDWDAGEDTSHDLDPLYARRLQTGGGGARGGVYSTTSSSSGGNTGNSGNASRQGAAPLDHLEARAAYRAAAGAGRGGGGGVSEVGRENEIDSDRRGAPSGGGGDGGLPSAGSHWSEKPLAELSDRDWRIMREDFDIHVRGGRPLHPLRGWGECGMAPQLRAAIDDMGYAAPSPIQRQAIPMGLAGRDLIGIAETGSGKTAAFLIPLLSYILSQPPAARARLGDDGPLALVMAPTRELAQQIGEECAKLCRHTDIKAASVVGGLAIQEQGTVLRQGVDVVIGTPGRLIDMLDNRYLVLHQCAYVVLDEADRMIDLGFEPQVTAVLSAMSSEGGAGGGGEGAEGDSGGAPAAGASTGYTGKQGRTTHMFSATFPREVQKLAQRFMVTPSTVQIGDGQSGKNKRIAQEVVFVGSEARKRQMLFDVLGRSAMPAIVFVNAKKQCDVVGRDMEARGLNCVVLHGGKDQSDREGALASFKAGEHDILLATDVAGRGLDIPDVATVVNYDMPSEIDKYTHRIGRTGRAGKSGKAITFLVEEDAPVLPALKAYLEATGQSVPPELAQKASGEGGPRRDKIQYAKK